MSAWRGLGGAGCRQWVGTCAVAAFMGMAVGWGVRSGVVSGVSGSCGKGFAGIGQACGRDVVTREVAPGKTVDPDMLRDALIRTEVDAVTLVHSETSTGALAPLEQLAEGVHDFDGVMLLVDAVAALAGCPG